MDCHRSLEIISLFNRENMINVFDKLGNSKQLLEDDDIQSENNYIKFPDGTLICYGEYAIEDDFQTTIIFPYVFFDSNYSLMLSQKWYDIAQTYVINNLQKGSCDIVLYNNQTNGVNGTYRGTYIAVGRWK